MKGVQANGELDEEELEELASFQVHYFPLTLTFHQLAQAKEQHELQYAEANKQTKSLKAKVE